MGRVTCLLVITLASFALADANLDYIEYRKWSKVLNDPNLELDTLDKARVALRNLVDNKDGFFGPVEKHYQFLANLLEQKGAPFDKIKNEKADALVALVCREMKLALDGHLPIQVKPVPDDVQAALERQQKSALENLFDSHTLNWNNVALAIRNQAPKDDEKDEAMPELTQADLEVFKKAVEKKSLNELNSESDDGAMLTRPDGTKLKLRLRPPHEDAEPGEPWNFFLLLPSGKRSYSRSVVGKVTQNPWSVTVERAHKAPSASSPSVRMGKIVDQVVATGNFKSTKSALLACDAGKNEMGPASVTQLDQIELHFDHGKWVNGKSQLVVGEQGDLAYTQVKNFDGGEAMSTWARRYWKSIRTAREAEGVAHVDAVVTNGTHL